MRCSLSFRYLVTLHYISDTHLIQDNEWSCVPSSVTRRSVESDAGLERGTISVNYLSSSGSECGLRDVTAAAAAGATTRWTLFQRSRHRHSLQLLAVAAHTGNVDVDNRVGLRCKLEHTLIVKSAVSRAGARTWTTSSDCNYRASVTLAGAPGWCPGPRWRGQPLAGSLGAAQDGLAPTAVTSPGPHWLSHQMFPRPAQGSSSGNLISNNYLRTLLSG